jgi:transcriptional regulator with XRE-family HTH domain
MAKVLRSPAHRQLIAWVQRARRSADLTQSELAQALRKPQSFVAKIEGGERRLEVIEFIGLCRALGRDPGQAIQELEYENED